MCSHSNAQELILLWLSMVISNPGHCFIGCFLSCFNLFNWAGLNWQLQFFFSESSCETKSRGKKLSHFLFSFGGRFWRTKKWVSWLWAVNFSLQAWWQQQYQYSNLIRNGKQGTTVFVYAVVMLVFTYQQKIDWGQVDSVLSWSRYAVGWQGWFETGRFFCSTQL